jgi:hypothetical protein
VRLDQAPITSALRAQQRSAAVHRAHSGKPSSETRRRSASGASDQATT